MPSVKTEWWVWLRRTPRLIKRREDSKSSKAHCQPGHIRWLPAGGFTCAIRIRFMRLMCGRRSRAVSLSVPDSSAKCPTNFSLSSSFVSNRVMLKERRQTKVCRTLHPIGQLSAAVIPAPFSPVSDQTSLHGVVEYVSNRGIEFSLANHMIKTLVLPKLAGA